MNTSFFSPFFSWAAFPSSKPHPGLVLCLCCLLLSGCAGKAVFAPATGQPAPPYAQGQLVRPDGSLASEDDLLRLADAAGYILVGERHDNPVDHKVQASIVNALAQAGKEPLLGLEMLPRNRYDRQLTAFTQGAVSLEELPAALDWPQTWGFAFALYSPVFEVAQNRSLSIHGLNIPNELRFAVSRKGLNGLNAEEKKELPRRILPPLPEQREKLQAFFLKHKTMLAQSRAAGEKLRSAEPNALPKASVTTDKQDLLERFLLIQSLWDSVMAEQATLLRARVMPKKGPQRPMVILAGGGHVERGYGIASRLKILDPSARSLLIMPFSEAKPEPGEADLFYYSPQPEADFDNGQGTGQRRSAQKRPPIGVKLSEEGGKVAIMAVTPGSRAEKAGLMPGDILARAGSFQVESLGDLHRAAAEAAKQGAPLSLAVLRQGKPLAVFL